MKRFAILLLCSLVFFSCTKKDEVWSEVKTKPISKKKEFGFTYSDFNVVQDTLKSGDTFGSIIQKQNIGDKKVFELVEQIKDSFDVRSIRNNKPYTLLRSKNKTKELLVFVYQPDALHYYVVDFRDSIAKAYKKTKPITIKRRTIGGVLKSSLSETLESANVEGGLASRIAKIYAWSIDFFKLKRGDRFAITFTERYINDSIYDGVDSLEASFFEYKGKIIYAFPFVANPSSNRIEYYDEEGLYYETRDGNLYININLEEKDYNGKYKIENGKITLLARDVLLYKKGWIKVEDILDIIFNENPNFAKLIYK